MNPTLVPTLAELRDEIDRTHAHAEAIYASIHDGMPEAQRDALGAQWEEAAALRDKMLDAMAEIPATSIADLRAKAHALALMDRITDGETVENPSEGEAKLMRQIIAGLLDGGIA